MIEDSQGNIFATGYIYLPDETGAKQSIKSTPMHKLIRPSVHRSCDWLQRDEYAWEDISGKVCWLTIIYPRV